MLATEPRLSRFSSEITGLSAGAAALSLEAVVSSVDIAGGLPELARRFSNEEKTLFLPVGDPTGTG